MNRKISSPQTTLVVLLGASEWPRSSEFQSSKAFVGSARGFKNYLLDSRGFRLPSSNLLDLFDQDQTADDLDRAIGDFLDQRIESMKTSGQAARDLIVYYVGHGGFAGDEAEYYLAIRRTRSNNPGASSIRVASLAVTLKEKARYLRRTVILDCCFSAAAFRSFQSAPSQVAVQQSIDAFKEKGQRSGFPERGTALLCSSGPRVPSLISRDGKYTMFTEAFLNALTAGDIRHKDRTYLSLRDLTNLIADILHDSQEDSAPRPFLHSPDQSEGDVADIDFFPNPASKISTSSQNPIIFPTPINTVDITDMNFQDSSLIQTPTIIPLNRQRPAISSNIAPPDPTDLDSMGLPELVRKINSDKEVIKNIERLLDSVSSRELTRASISQFERELSKVIDEVRGVSERVAEQLFDVRDGVLQMLREARNCLNMASDQLDKHPNRTQSFYKNVNTCREHLEKAIKYWSGSDS